MKYIVYCRKSTESEDRQILSLPAQKRELDDYAKKHNLEIVEVLQESASAYKLGRNKFNQMVAKIQNGQADGMLVWALNRIARNALDGGMIIHLMDTGCLKEIRTPSNIVKSDGSAKFMLQIEFAMSKKSSDDNSESVKRGNREKILRGWHHRRHLGYKFVESEKFGWEKILVIDEERYELLKKAVHLVISGKPVRNVLKTLNNDWGFRTPKTKKLGNKPLSQSNFYKILHDEFYCGWIYTSDGQKIKGNHQPMITETEFDQLQVMLADRGKPRPKTLDLPFRTLISCGECGCTVCMEEKYQTICSVCKTKFASKNNKQCISCGTKISKMNNPTRLHYLYARCTKKKQDIKCGQPSLPYEDLINQISIHLDQLTISPKVVSWILNQLQKRSESQLKINTQSMKNLQSIVDRSQAELETLLKQFTSPENADYSLIGPDEYRNAKKQIIEKKENAETKLVDMKQQSDSTYEVIESAFNFAVTARDKFEKGDYQTKTDIIRYLGSNLVLKDRKIIIHQRYPWLFTKKVSESLQNLRSQGLEPERSIDLYEKNGIEDLAISTLQGYQGSNLDG
ncbi:MAG: hypothetical protein COY80_01945, partial [Candidatus Pacebacteria bacterium CG_4_10_14_0_8_um_filter_42_14]